MESNSFLCFLQVYINSLSKAERKDFVVRRLMDGSKDARRVVKEKLLPTWLRWFFLLFQTFFFSRMSESNSVCLLTCLNFCEPQLGVGVWHISAMRVLEVLFEQTSLQDLVDQFKSLTKDNLFPYYKLTLETSLYWRVLAHHIR